MILQTITGRGSGENASILVTGLSQSDTVTASKNGKTYNATWNGSQWAFSNLAEYGTYTITATNGAKTATETVTVDEAKVYSIEMAYRTYLYKYGDECTDITGGWSGIAVTNTTWSGTPRVPTVTKNLTNMRSYIATSNSSSGLVSANKINVTGCNKIYVDFSGVSGSYSGSDLDLGSTKGTYNHQHQFALIPTATNVARKTAELDISSISGEFYFTFVSTATSSVDLYVYNLWLE